MASGNARVERFLDADKEPIQTLMPIEGYEKKPLVSLEDAVIQMKTFFHELDAMVWTAKRNSRKPRDGLTPDESAAIHLYTMQWPQSYSSLYTLLNQALRSAQRDNLKPWFSYLKLFLTALYKLPSIKKTIWRGIHGDVNDQYNEDHIWWGVSSCTETMQVMERFVGRSGVRTLFMIECISGKAVRSHSFYKEENEILLMPGTYLRVVDKWSPAEGLYIIHLEELMAPYQLVTSPFDPISSSIEIPLLHTLTIPKTSLPSSYVASAQPPVPISSKLKSTPPGSTPPQYHNTKNEQKPADKKHGSGLSLYKNRLTNQDTATAAYYASGNNQVSHIPTSLHPGHTLQSQGVDLVCEIIPESFLDVDALIAGHLSSASQFAKQRKHHHLSNTPQLSSKSADADSDLEIQPDSSFWSDEEEQEQMELDNRQNAVPHHRQISRYFSTVNRSLLDRHSHLVADFYISQLNHAMQRNGQRIETIERDTAEMRYDHNQQFVNKTSDQLDGRLSIEHLY